MQARLNISPCDARAAFTLCDALGVSFALAQVLVRRGFADPASARAWLDAGEAHAPSAFAGIDVAVAKILEHVQAGTLITVHGDYDVDGVSSAAILIGTLRELGASVDWFLPSRTEDGYGLQEATVERLALRGTRLILTTDCAITAVESVAAARAAGIDVVVTDHHMPRADGLLPDAPIVHPAICGYPCTELCAGGVAYKLAGALLSAAGRDPAAADAHLDLVALATVADCVPLVGENRRLVREGLRAFQATQRPGLRALMRVAQADPSRLDEQAIGFRLAPRLNAAGRMQRADVALELLLTTDEQRAGHLADELDALNGERRHTEERIRFSAEAQLAQYPQDAPAYVLVGEDWHPGVIGIVASRIAERRHRPTILIAMDGDTGTGSGRSIPAYDLLAGLTAGSDHLLRHGGHRAAAGCTIARDEIDAFRAAFCAHARQTLTPEDLVATERVDAVVGGDELGMDLAEELRLLAPFGIANPRPSLLVPAARLIDARQMGEGKHVRFTVASGGVTARAVAFGTPSLPPGAQDGLDATFTLEVNEWQGAVEPRLVLRRATALAPGVLDVVGEPEEWDAIVRAELTAPLPGAYGEAAPSGAVRDRRGAGGLGVIAALAATGERVLVVVADVGARREALGARVGGVALTSWRALERRPDLAVGADHLVALDPPPHPALLAGADGPMTHLAWAAEGLGFAERVHQHLHDLRGPLKGLYRSLRDGDGDIAALASACARDGHPLHPVLAGRLLRVLDELGLISLDRDALQASVVPGVARRELEQSPAFCAYTARLQAGQPWLTRRTPRAA